MKSNLKQREKNKPCPICGMTLRKKVDQFEKHLIVCKKRHKI